MEPIYNTSAQHQTATELESDGTYNYKVAGSNNTYSIDKTLVPEKSIIKSVTYLGPPQDVYEIAYVHEEELEISLCSLSGYTQYLTEIIYNMYKNIFEYLMIADAIWPKVVYHKEHYLYI